MDVHAYEHETEGLKKHTTSNTARARFDRRRQKSPLYVAMRRAGAAGGMRQERIGAHYEHQGIRHLACYVHVPHVTVRRSRPICNSVSCTTGMYSSVKTLIPANSMYIEAPSPRPFVRNLSALNGSEPTDMRTGCYSFKVEVLLLYLVHNIRLCFRSQPCRTSGPSNRAVCQEKVGRYIT